MSSFENVEGEWSTVSSARNSKKNSKATNRANRHQVKPEQNKREISSREKSKGVLNYEREIKNAQIIENLKTSTTSELVSPVPHFHRKVVSRWTAPAGIDHARIVVPSPQTPFSYQEFLQLCQRFSLDDWNGPHIPFEKT